MNQKNIYDKINFIENLTNSKCLLSKDGVNISIWCPFCKHNNKNKFKLVIQLEKNYYHCWLCDKKGSNILNVVKKINISKVDELKKYFNIKSSNKSSDLSDIVAKLDYNFLKSDIDNIEHETVALPSDYKLLANLYNTTDPDFRDCFRYIIKRGIDKHKLYFLKIGVSKDLDFKRSIIIPSFDTKGVLNYYTSRKIDVDTHNTFKYKNASIKKNNIIFNELNIDWSLPLTLVEGPLDLLKTNDNATCLLGSSLTKDMKLFNEIVKNKTEVMLALDKDVYHKSLKIANLLTEYDIKVNIIDTRIANDVGDMKKEDFLKLLDESKEFIKEDSLLRKISLL